MGVINRAPKQSPAPDLAPIDARLDALELPFIRGRALEGFRWYKAFRINNVPNDPNSFGEGTSVLFEVLGQSDFGNTANSQSSRLFASFGVRGGVIAPVLTVWGNRRMTNDAASMDLRVYKNDDGYYWLYIRTAVYSMNSIRYYIAGYDQGVSDPFEAVDSITFVDGAWSIPKPSGSGELIWSYDDGNAYQPFIIGKGYALTSTDSGALLIAGPGGDSSLSGGVPVRFQTNRVISDDTGRRQEDHAYHALESWNGNTDLGASLHHYSLELEIKQGQAGAELTVLPQRNAAPYLYAHKRMLRGGNEVLSIAGTIRLEPWQSLWFDISCPQDWTLGAGSTLQIYRGVKR